MSEMLPIRSAGNLGGEACNRSSDTKIFRNHEETTPGIRSGQRTAGLPAGSAFPRLVFTGAGSRDRTGDLPLTRRVLYQLS
jgi:hypothetical protein